MAIRSRIAAAAPAEEDVVVGPADDRIIETGIDDFGDYDVMIPLFDDLFHAAFVKRN